MPAYAALGLPDSIQITCRHIFRLFFEERATQRPWQASGCLAQLSGSSRTLINGKKMFAKGAPGPRGVTPAFWRFAVAVWEWRQA